MNRRKTTIAILACISLLLVWAAISQGHQLSDLRNQQRTVVERLAGPAEPAALTAPPKELPMAPAGQTNALSELLHLRAEVNRLTRRKQELVGAVAENDRLKVELEKAKTNSGPALPPGYIRRSSAQKIGFSSPEHTLETFLWAVEHKDSGAFLECLTPESQQKIREAQRSSGASLETLLGQSGQIPGLRILSRETNGPDALELYLEAGPGLGLPSSISARRLNGEWKLGFFD